MKKLLFFLILMVESFFLMSQNIKITILDSISNEPIPYASISFIDINTGTYSNPDGTFNINKDDLSVEISHVAYQPKKLVLSSKNAVIKLIPKDYKLNEVTVFPNSKEDIIGYFKNKSDFTIPGFSGDEMAVYIPNTMNLEKNINKIIIGFDKRKVIKKDLNIDFISIFRINFYKKYENSYEPGILIFVDDLVFNSKIIEKETIIDLLKYNIKLPKEGLFVSIEWIGIQSEKTKELNTNYKERIEPFISTTFNKTNTYVFERNKLKEKNWKLIDKNNPYCILLKKDNFYTPRISLSLYK